MTQLANLKPAKNHKVFDLAQQAGFDISDWVASSNDSRGHKANPKYCYEWAFIEPHKVVIFNLWHANMLVENGSIKQRGNFRIEAASHEGPDGKSQWRTRALRLDEALQTALDNNLAIRVIIVDGKQRDLTDPSEAKKPARVFKRELDPEPWSLTSYNRQTGEFELTRGILRQDFIDQFDIDKLAKAEPKKVNTNTTIYHRDPRVRRAALRRAGGRCELCCDAGFLMAGGAIYLETHHVIPLSEGGSDHISNVVGLCPTDHRRAHYAQDRDTIRSKLLNFLGGLSA